MKKQCMMKTNLEHREVIVAKKECWDCKDRKICWRVAF